MKIFIVFLAGTVMTLGFAVLQILRMLKTPKRP